MALVVIFAVTVSGSSEAAIIHAMPKIHTVNDVLLIAGHLPPHRGGLPDQTARLALELRKKGLKIYIATLSTEVSDLPQVDGEIVNELPHWGLSGVLKLISIVRKVRPDIIVFPWVPHFYDRRGIVISLPFGLFFLRLVGFRIHTIVYEMYVPATSLKTATLNVLQKVALTLIVCASYEVSVGIIAWTRWIQKRFPWKKKKIYFIPTGSNIPRTICSYSAESFRKKNGIARTATVLATFISIGSGRGIEFVSQFWREIREIYPETTLVLLGGGNLPATSKLVCDPRVLVTDFLSSEKVSNWLSNSDIYIAHFDDGITCRRGSLMAALEHSLPVVSNRGFQWDKEVFENSPVTLADLNPESFIEAIRPLIINADFRKKQGELTRKFFESNFSWSVLTAQLFPWAQSKDPN